ncbi:MULTISPECIES: dynamin family protein [Bacillus]|uniref:dynamin family protein n=1 Tax=Bacillus TaxID=1386 RepID=UPI0008FE53C5|nr:MULTISPECIES: dynamin family protein [Bacillus cereus group]ONG91660.1 dynamin [Bacillus cereus]MCH5438480.1 dynamin family protein [Bacillus paranthracis]MCM0001647.1 dynamin family protein [Bacillus paranthracis]MCR6794806.1 dynamin family protein [Bacillus paranthracis]MCU5171786.1 dynamin family protein [Bacillus paranthracis]
MKELKSGIEQLKLSPENRATFNQLISQSELDHAVVGVFGSFSVGKSELLNKIIGRDKFLPTHTNETTAIVTSIHFGDEEKIELMYIDGSVENVSMESFHELVAGGNVSGIEKINVSLSEPEWLRHVEFIDTPGRNTKFAAHVEASNKAIIDADAAIYVLPWQGLIVEDIIYLKDLMIYQPNLYFILNKVDRIDEEQGQTIEEVRKQVEENLAEQLGKRYPVYAISAKTGFNFSKFKEELIPQITSNIKELKQSRFTHAIGELIEKHILSIQNEIQALKLTTLQDKQAVQDQKRKIEMEQTRLDDHVKKELSLLKEALKHLQVDADSFIEATLGEVIKEIKTRVNEMYEKRNNGEELQQIIENHLLTARNKIYQRFEEKLNPILKDKNHYKLSELEGSGLSIQFQEPSFEELQKKYEERLQEITTRYDNKGQRLNDILSSTNEDVSPAEIEKLRLEISELEEKVQEEYVPQYIIDQNFDPDKAKKIMKSIGLAGDVVVSIAAAYVTAGVSAGAQVAGKAAGATSQLAKQATKEASKQVAKEVSKKVVEQTAKTTGKEMFKKAGLKSLRVIGKIASPFETAATAIGTAIDENRKADKTLDINHRQKFFMKQQHIESQFQRKKDELNQLKEQQKSNATIARSVEMKIERIEQEKNEEIQRAEKAMRNNQVQFNKLKFEESMYEQLSMLGTNEQEKYKSWIKLETGRVYLMLEKMLPSYYEEEMSRGIAQLVSVEESAQVNMEDINERFDILHNELTICNDIKQEIYHG